MDAFDDLILGLCPAGSPGQEAGTKLFARDNLSLNGVTSVPICGRGKPEAVEAIKGLPAWIVVGDEDGVSTVQNARSMAQALRDAGASPQQTEYRAVGHNSWDRAYNDPALVDWMISQARKAP